MVFGESLQFFSLLYSVPQFIENLPENHVWLTVTSTLQVLFFNCYFLSIDENIKNLTTKIYHLTRLILKF